MKTSFLSIPLLLVAALCVGVPSAVSQDTVQHAADGGTRQRVESIEVPAISNVPFRAVVVTTVTYLMPDGNKRVVSNHRTIARDSAGRVFQQRRYLMPDGTDKSTPLTALQYDDPNEHSRTLCSRDRTCRVYNWSLNTAPAKSVAPSTIKLPNGITIANESLGTDTVSGLEVIKSRETMTIPAGLEGNQKAINVVKEFWYSPRLEINVMTRRIDPRIASIQTFDVTNIDLSEPDPALLQIPAGFKVIQASDSQ